MEKQIITQKIYEVIKPKIKESDNPLIEDYIPASSLMDLQRDLANLVENLVIKAASQAVPNGGKLDAKTFVAIMNYKDKVLKKLLEFYKFLDNTGHPTKEKILVESCIDKVRIIDVE